MIRQLVNRLLGSETGNVLMIFAGSVVVLVVIVGAAIDLSRYLMARTQAQVALDNAILAASAVRERQPVQEVATRFFNANFPDAMGRVGAIRITESSESEAITGEVDVFVNSYFGGFLGIDEYKFSGFGEVRFGEADAEIVLVLDHSRSMCQSNSFGGPITNDPSCRKLDALRRASTQFVDTIFGANQLRGAYIGIVPFNHNVLMHPALGKHPSLGADVNIAGGVAASGMVPITELTNNQSLLTNRINSMGPPHRWATTRTNVGSAVGALMLMPYEQDRRYFQHSTGFPQEFDPFSRDKVLVIMTDGANSTRLQWSAREMRLAGQPYQLDFSDSPTDNNHQAALCRHLKEHYEIVIYTVTYDMPDSPQATPIKNVFRNCATNRQFYFDAQSDQDLIIAYETIAQSINKLRLSR